MLVSFPRFKQINMPRVLVVTCNLILGRPNEEDCEFKTTLENIVRPHLKKTKVNQTNQPNKKPFKKKTKKTKKS